MNKCCISVLCLASLMLFSGCDESKQNPNVMFSEKHQDPIQELEKHSKKVDHSKFGKVRPARMGELKRFDTIISDNRPDDEFVEYAKAQRITLKY